MARLYLNKDKEQVQKRRNIFRINGSIKYLKVHSKNLEKFFETNRLFSHASGENSYEKFKMCMLCRIRKNYSYSDIIRNILEIYEKCIVAKICKRQVITKLLNIA